MKTKLLTLLAVLITTAVSTRAQVLPGDIAIIQVNNTTDGFTWVALKDINATATVTDSSWGAAGGQGWRTTENTTTTLPSTIAAGTIGFTTIGSGLNNGGEQLFLYNNDGTNFTATTTAAQAKFIFGLNWDNSGWLTSGTYGTSTSYLPSTLAGYSLTLGTGDNWYYNGTTTGTSASLLAEITNSANWLSSVDTQNQFAQLRPNVSSFSVIPEPSTYALIFGAFAFGLVLTRRLRRA